MEDVSDKEVVASLALAIDFGVEISSVLHTLGAQDRTVGSSDFVLITDGTTRVLSQIQGLVQQGLETENAVHLFNQTGLNYVKLAAEEVVLVFLMFEGISVESKVLKRGRRIDIIKPNLKGSAKEEIEKRGIPIVVDQVALLRKMENLAVKDSRILVGMVSYLTDRLNDLKNHLHLMQQVVSVHAMTKSPNGIKDLKVIVDSYDRIQRAAGVTGIWSGYGRHLGNSERMAASTSSDSESDSDSSFDEIPVRKMVSSRSSTDTLRPRTFIKCNARRAPIQTVVDIAPASRPPNLNPVSNQHVGAGISTPSPEPRCGLESNKRHQTPDNMPPPGPRDFAFPQTSNSSLPDHPEIIDVSNFIPKPPEYSEKEHLNSTPLRMNTDASICSGTTVVGTPGVVEKPSAAQSDEKEVHEKDSDASSVATYQTRSSDASSVSTACGNGYIKEMKSKTWRFKRLFRSKQSLETELQDNLKDDNKYLSAYLLQGRKYRKIPHSDIHSVEWTHIHTIISQMKGNGWYNTFTNLSTAEQRAYTAMMPEGAELLALKIVKTNQRNAWVRMLVRLAGGSNDLPHLKDGRIILAIIREDDGYGSDNSSVYSSISSGSEDDRPSPHVINMPPPPPPARPSFFKRPPPPPPPVGRPASFSSSQNMCKPPNPGPFPLPSSLPGFKTYEPDHVIPQIKPLVVPQIEHHALGQPPPRSIGPGFRPPPPPPPPRSNICSVRLSDVTPIYPVNEIGAVIALTSYESYTFRQCAPADNSTISWVRCSVTHEQISQSQLRERVQNYQARGGDVISDKLRLLEAQARQVSRLMDGLNTNENDKRFIWTMGELSFLNKQGEVFPRKFGNMNNVAVMHVTAVRQLLENLNAMSVYESIKRSLDFPSPPMHFPPPVRAPPPARPPPRRCVRPRWHEDSDGYDSESSSDNSSVSAPRRHHRVRWNNAIHIKLDDSDGEVDLVKRLLKLWTTSE